MRHGDGALLPYPGSIKYIIAKPTPVPAINEKIDAEPVLHERADRSSRRSCDESRPRGGAPRDQMMRSVQIGRANRAIVVMGFAVP